MKKVFGLLYATFPAVLLLAQAAPPARPAEGSSTPEAPQVGQMLRSMPKRYPPELMPASGTTRSLQMKLAHKYCVQPGADGKSLSVKPCSPVTPVRLIAPFKTTGPVRYH